MSRYHHLSEPDPEWVQIAATLPARDESISIGEQRRLLSKFAQAQNELWDYPRSGLQVSNTNIAVHGGSIQVRIYVPEGVSAPFPLLVWYHGGGFKVGDLELDDAFLRLVCVRQRVSCVNVDYRLVPECPFPTPLEDCYLATQWAVTNASSLSADPSRGLLIGGTSAGAHLAAVIALKARDDPSFPGKLTGQILQVPSVCPPSVYPEKWKGQLLSMDQNKDAPALTRERVVEIFVEYGAPDLTSPEVAPLLAPTHRGLPPTYIQICGFDPLRDEAFLFEEVLRDSGVPTKFDVYPGQPHGFNLFGPQMTQSKKWMEDVLKGVEWLLNLPVV